MPRPGLLLLRRDAHSFRVGLEWPGTAVIGDSPALRAVLGAVDGMRRDVEVIDRACRSHPDEQACLDALRALVDTGVLVDCDGPWEPVHDDPAAVAAWWLHAGPRLRADDLVDARRRFPVSIRGHGRLAEALAQALDCVGVPRVREESARLVICASDREPSRDDADDLQRAGRPYLWVHLRDLVGVVGPWVRPTRSACLRCVDAACNNLDPTWLTVVDACLAAAPAGHAADPLLVQCVAAWAAALVARGARPDAAVAAGEVTELTPAFGVRTTAYDIHPQCGCTWPAWHATMEA